MLRGMFAPAATPAPVPLVVPPALFELLARLRFVAGCVLLHPRTPRLIARVLLALPKAVVFVGLYLLIVFGVRGFCVFTLAVGDVVHQVDELLRWVAVADAWSVR